MDIRLSVGPLLSIVLAASSAMASVTIDAYTYDLNQFTGAAVTYRSNANGGTVTFDGKTWDNVVGVDGVTPGELAAGQFGSDPGDQISLNKRTSPDWFQLTYAGAGLTIGGSDRDTFVVYEITSSGTATPADVEATSWRISFNGGALINASAGIATFLDFTPPAAENVYQIAFNLLDFGFSPGELLKTVYIENIDTGSSTSDPDFIFMALEGSESVVPELSSIATWSVLALAISSWAYRKKSVRHQVE